MRNCIKSCYYNKDKMITYICKHHYKYFLNKAYVVGIGLGYKRKRNLYTCEKCIQVFVMKKFSPNQISVKDMIPPTYRGIKTDVIQVGRFVQSSLRKRIRPVKGGYGISPEYTDREATSGCLVTNGVSKFILSAGHVLSINNTLPIGHGIIQPPQKYGGVPVNDIVATLYRYVPIRFIQGEYRPINLVDVGLGLVSNYNIVTPEIAFIGKVTSVKSPILNSTIKKVGSVTELTQGVITGVSVTIEVTFGGRLSLFSDQIITTKIGNAGDSGSLIVNNNNCAVGILFGTSDEANVGCRLDTALDQLEVHLVQ